MPILHWLNDEEARKTSSQIPYRLLEADPKLSYESPSPVGEGLGVRSFFLRWSPPSDDQTVWAESFGMFVSM